MIAVYLTEEWTQVVRANIRRGKFNIVSGAYLDPYLQDLLRSDVGQITELFREVQSLTKTKDDEVYVILPDYVFRKIGCYNDAENLEIEIKDDLHVPIETCSLSYPITIDKKTLKKKTVCALDRSYIDVLISSAKQMKMPLVSIEPAGFVFLKSTRKWEKEQMALFISEKTASILSYSPLGGMFVRRLGQNLSYAKEHNNVDILNVVMNEILANADYANKNEFRLANKNVPVYIVADNFGEYFKLPSLQQRYADLPINNGLIDDVSDDEYREFLIPITALYESYLPTTISSSRLPFMGISSANVIPQDVSKSSRRVMLRKAIKRWAQVAMVAGVSVVGVEVAGSIYFSSITVPENLQRDYSIAQEKQADLNNELERINQRNSEDENIMTGLRSIISSKPETVGFTEVEVGQKGISPDDPKRFKNWIHFTAKTKDPMVIQDYISRLSENPLFNSVVVEEISSDNLRSDSVKRAKLVVGRSQ